MEDKQIPNGSKLFLGEFPAFTRFLDRDTFAVMALGSDDSNQNPSPGPQGKVTLKVFSEVIPAESVASLLKANGISCWLQADDCGGMLSALDSAQGVKLLVNPADAETARALLAAMPDAAAFEAMVNSAPTSEASPLPRSGVLIVALLQIGGGAVAGILLCLLYQWTSNLGTRSYPYDTNGDGRADENWIFHDGYLVEETLDRNFDGQLDGWYKFDRNSRRLDSTADDNFDGVVDTWWRYTNGVLVASREDTDFNGTPDVTYSFKYDILTKADWQPNGTNIVTLRQIYRYGVLIEEQRDTNWDGTFDFTVRYDAFQNRIATNATR